MAGFKGAAPPPPGVIPGRDDAPYSGNAIVVVNAFFIPVTILFLAARTYTRLRLTRSMGLDDGDPSRQPFTSWNLFALGQHAITLLQIKYGLGTHMWDIPIATFSPTYLRLQLSSVFIYMLAILFVKLAVLQLYLRISGGKTYRLCVWLIIAATIAYTIGSAVAHFATCEPFAKNFYPMMEGTCFNKSKMALARAVLNVVNDIIILLLPVPILHKLQLPKGQKLALVAVFSTGVFVCVVTVVRLTHYVRLLGSKDLTWDTVNAFTWCIVEVDVGIICACMATLRPLLRRFLPSLMGSSGAPKDSHPSGISGSGSRPGLDVSGRFSTSKPREFTTLGSRSTDSQQQGPEKDSDAESMELQHTGVLKSWA
ncbi:MAG: hypothetical protein M1833_002607 [Piccolia ochrophora]|nr:MAG: hypothetical protein M1833_002607 [Piccolia ochrophora]